MSNGPLKPIPSHFVLSETYGQVTRFHVPCTICKSGGEDITSKDRNEAAQKFTDRGWRIDYDNSYCPKCAANEVE